MTLFVLMSLAAYRLTRIVTLDVVTTRPRKWLQTRADGKLEYFVTCPWCVGWYVSAGIVAITAAATSVPLPLLQFLAVACLVGLIGANLDGE